MWGTKVYIEAVWVPFVPVVFARLPYPAKYPSVVSTPHTHKLPILIAAVANECLSFEGLDKTDIIMKTIQVKKKDNLLIRHQFIRPPAFSSDFFGPLG